MASPLVIEIVLHYHCSTVDFRDIKSAPAVAEAIENFLSAGLLKPDTDPATKRKYELTRGGMMYAGALMDVPFPEQLWVVPGHWTTPDKKERKILPEDGGK